MTASCGCYPARERGAANFPAKPPALPERIEAVLQLRELSHEVIISSGNREALKEIAMSQDRNHLSHATWECKYHVDSRRSTARSCCLGKSGGTWALYFTSLPGARNARSKKDTQKGRARSLRNFLGHKFWARGVGRDEETIRTYIRNQEMADKQLDQLQLKLATS